MNYEGEVYTHNVYMHCSDARNNDIMQFIAILMKLEDIKFSEVREGQTQDNLT